MTTATPDTCEFNTAETCEKCGAEHDTGEDLCPKCERLAEALEAAEGEHEDAIGELEEAQDAVEEARAALAEALEAARVARRTVARTAKKLDRARRRAEA